jgi:hypothetical protein
MKQDWLLKKKIKLSVEIGVQHIVHRKFALSHGSSVGLKFK